jgi:transcriptional regulator with XRE-family HTH domain
MTNSTNIKRELGQRIRNLRKRQGMTQEEMADKCGLHWTYIGGLERGERNPTLTTMQKVALGLGVGLTDLIQTKVFQAAAEAEQSQSEGKLMKLLRRRDAQTMDLASGIVREVLHWREKYETGK